MPCQNMWGVSPFRCTEPGRLPVKGDASRDAVVAAGAAVVPRRDAGGEERADRERHARTVRRPQHGQHPAQRLHERHEQGGLRGGAGGRASRGLQSCLCSLCSLGGRTLRVIQSWFDPQWRAIRIVVKTLVELSSFHKLSQKMLKAKDIKTQRENLPQTSIPPHSIFAL